MLTIAAASCQKITNDINVDITKYSDNIKNQDLPWMKLSWLQNQLGSADAKKTFTDKTQYEWRCGDSGAYLIADVNNNGSVLAVKGEYNSSDGSGLFDAQLPDKSAQEFDQMISQLNADSAPVPPPAPPAPQNQDDEKCKNIIAQIRSDLAAYSDPIQRQNLSWMNVSWLKQKLGQPHTQTTYDYVYKWPAYSLFIGTDGTKGEYGILPKGIHPQTFAEAAAVLGRPKKTIFEKLAENQWNCPVNNSSLTLLTTGSAQITNIMGKDCSASDKCNMFFYSPGSSELKRQFAQESSRQEQIASAMLTTRLRNYNNIYKTAFISQDELDTDMTLRIKNYYSSIRQCRQGIYYYVMPVLQDFLYHTAVIRPQKDGHCMVNTSYTIPQIGKVDLKCNYQPDSLQLFTDAEAAAALTNTTPFNDTHPSEMQKVIEGQCKRYIDGVL